MSEIKTEILIDHAVFNQLSAAFKMDFIGIFVGGSLADGDLDEPMRGVTVQKYYGQPDVVSIVEASITGALVSEDAKKIGLKVEIPKMVIDLNGDHCKIDSKVHVASPISGDITILGTLANAQEKGKLAWEKEPNISLSFLLKTALAAAGKSGEVAKQIDDIKSRPSEMIANVFKTQMALRKIDVTECQMQLEGKQLVVTLKGGPLTSK